MTSFSISRRFLFTLLTAGIAVLVLASVACGGGDDDGGGGADGGQTPTSEPTDNGGGDDGGQTPTSEPTDNGGGDGGEVSFDIEMSDGPPNKFEPTEFTVSTGAAVTFNLTNVGAAIHNMRIAGEDGEYNTGDDAVSDPDLISGGGTGTLEWTAPDSPGEIKFQCDFHPTDMKGTITVE